MSDIALTPPPARNLVGTWRRFGPVGPVYEIIGICDASIATDVRLRVRVVETDEEIDYPLANVLDDPAAR